MSSGHEGSSCDVNCLCDQPGVGSSYPAQSHWYGLPQHGSALAKLTPSARCGLFCHTQQQEGSSAYLRGRFTYIDCPTHLLADAAASTHMLYLGTSNAYDPGWWPRTHCRSIALQTCAPPPDGHLLASAALKLQRCATYEAVVNSCHCTLVGALIAPPAEC